MRKYFFVEKRSILLYIGICFLLALLNVGVAIILEKIIDTALSGNISLLAKMAMFGCIYVIMLSFVYYLFARTQNKLINNIVERLRADVFQGIYSLSFESYNKSDTTKYISHVINDVQIIENDYIKPIFCIIQDSLTFVLTVILLIRYSGVITFWITIMLIISLLVPNFIGKIMRIKQIEYAEQLEIFTGKLRDYFSGFEIIKMSSVIDVFYDKFISDNSDVVRKKRKKDNIGALGEGASCLLSSVIQISVIIIGGFMVARGEITIGILTALIQLCSMFTSPISNIIQDVTIIKGSNEVIERISRYNNCDINGMKSHPDDKQCDMFEKLELINCEYSYNENEFCLSDINISFKKGCHYMLLGSNGSGKSTLVRLLSGQYTKYRGTICINGRMIDAKESCVLCEKITVIPQEIFLFNDTVLNNITLYREYNEKDIKKALCLSGVSAFLEQLPDGLNTVVGENACNLSGGQKQRIAVARALIQKKEIIVLDESTSAIDEKTAYEIEKSILEIADLTVIVITHAVKQELQTYYDEIIWMEKGKIAKLENLREGKLATR